MVDFSNFAELRKNKGKGIQALSEQLEKLNKSNNFSDDRIWKPNPDKAGNYAGIIRFLPPPKNENTSFVRRYNHGFSHNGQRNGRWFIENCPTSIEKPCPVCEMNSEIWNRGGSENENLVRTRKRKLSYYSNILVIKDPSNPENEGKVFLFRYGKKIFDMIEAAINPAVINPNDDFTEPCDIFDMWEGANFKIVMKKVDGYTNYDSSSFYPPTAIEGTDKELEKIWLSEYSLQAEIAEDKFLPYDKLKAKMNKILNIKPVPATMTENASASGSDESIESVMENLAANSAEEEAPFKSLELETGGIVGADEPDPLEEFEKLLMDADDGG